MKATKLFRHHTICDRCDQARILQSNELQYLHRINAKRSSTSSGSATSAYDARTSMCVRRALGQTDALIKTARYQERKPDRIDSRPCTNDTANAAFTAKPRIGTHNYHRMRLGRCHKPSRWIHGAILRFRSTSAGTRISPMIEVTNLSLTRAERRNV